ncbi:MAG: 50S ribosomal protein L24 [Candidatus Micrarchaeota archaeon]
MKYSKNVTVQPRKRRKALYNAKIHEVRALLNIHLSKELRKKYKKRALLAKKGDKVKILRGEFKKREGKIVDVDYKEAKIWVEGIIYKKQGGKEKQFPIQPSNCILLEWVEPKLSSKRKATVKAAGSKMASQLVKKPPVEVKKIITESKSVSNEQKIHVAKVASEIKTAHIEPIKQ